MSISTVPAAPRQARSTTHPAGESLQRTPVSTTRHTERKQCGPGFSKAPCKARTVKRSPHRTNSWSIFTMAALHCLYNRATGCGDGPGSSNSAMHTASCRQAAAATPHCRQRMKETSRRVQGRTGLPRRPLSTPDPPCGAGPAAIPHQ